ncbi:MAG TPA: hypothetical protein VHV10_18600 [Ktedonobacteraceae bacterium]|jgi:hypothetical protein|nr:hypothetical protein [Ktedonobacteraceae bacterium]
MQSVFGGIKDWFLHPTFDTDTDPKDWILGLLFVLVVSFLWSRVIKQLVEN